MRAKLLNVTQHLFCLFVVSAIALGCAHTNPRLDESVAAVPRHSATEPAHRLSDHWWEKRHEGVLKLNREKDPEIILIGDSITHAWDSQMEIWNDRFGDYAMVNMGFGGDRTQHVLWRFDHGEIDRISPKLAMIMIGTNNSNGKDNTGQEIGEGIVAICAQLRDELPDTELLVLSIFPRGPRPSGQREKNEEASQIAKRFAQSDEHIHFLDINDAFLTDDGTLTKEIMPDFLHPNATGYEIWASEIEDEVHRLMDR